MRSKLFLSGLGLTAALSLATTLTDEFEIVKNLEIFSNIYKEINTYYVDEVDPERSMRYGLEAMLRSLDPYTAYISPEEVEAFQSSLSGQYFGVGAALSEVKGRILVEELYEGGSALEGGLQIGDEIIEADGKLLKGMKMDEVIALLRGAAGTKAKIKVQRGDKNLNLELLRRDIKISHLPLATHLQQDYGYIALTAFSEGIAEQLRQACVDLSSQKPLKGLILDLRNNSGGLLNEAVNVVNLFVEKNQVVVQTKGRDLEKNQVYKTLNQPFSTDLPLIVLINERSASASEIVAGALQDFDRALIVGRRSFGKGLVQHTQDVGFGAKIKFTAARYYIPSGRCIQAQAYENGLPKALPDSLRAAFKTLNGRVVYDGGGITPDFATHDADLDRFIRQLQGEWLIFDFALEYRRKQAQLPSPQALDLSQTDFDAFMAFLKTRNFELHLPLDQELDELQKALKKEGYLDAIKADLQALERSLLQSKEAQLTRYRQAILRSLKNEILRQTYLEKGMLQGNLKDDPDLQKSLELLTQPSVYNKKLQGKG